MPTLQEELERLGFQRFAPKEEQKKYDEYRDQEIIKDHISTLAESKRALYHAPKMQFTFKRKSSKAKYILEVDKIMRPTDKGSASYISVLTLKQLDKACTSKELAAEVEQLHPGLTKESSIGVLLTRIATLTPDVVRREYEDGKVKYRYVSTIAEGAVEVAYARFKDALFTRRKEMKGVGRHPLHPTATKPTVTEPTKRDATLYALARRIDGIETQITDIHVVLQGLERAVRGIDTTINDSTLRVTEGVLTMAQGAFAPISAQLYVIVPFLQQMVRKDHGLTEADIAILKM